MNNRGQAALEYLMTYGWALIVIAIVVGVLVFIVSSPGQEVVCNSSDPAKVMVKASQIDNSTGDGSIIITNLTGGDMSSVTVMNDTDMASGGAFAGDDFTDGGTITSGAQMTLGLTGTATSGTYSTSSIGIAYTDYAGFVRDANITCNGPITIP